MTRILVRPLMIAFAASSLLLAQPPADPQPAETPAGGWRRVSDPPPAPPETPGPQAATAAQDPTQPVERDAYGQPQPQSQPQPAPAEARPTNRPAYGLPPQVTLKAGSFVNLRVDQILASNHNQPGDTFSGTLIQPVVVDGVVIARRGQTVYGRVTEADKVKGVAHLGIELTSLTLADGSQVGVHSRLVARQGGKMPNGEQAGIIGTTTAAGAVIGSAADWGTGAAIGAGAGAAAGIVGVLLTRNRPSVIYPETALTFETSAPLTVSTGSAPQAFRFVGPEDYDRPTQVVQRAPVQRPVYYGPGYYPYYPYYPYYWGPSVMFGGGFFRGGGYRRWR